MPAQIHVNQGKARLAIPSRGGIAAIGGSQVPSAFGEDGREVQLQKSATHIQWRYEGDAAWTNLVALSELEGDPGAPGETGPMPYDYRGAWDGFTSYGLYDAVTYQGSLYWLPATGGWTIGGAPPAYNWELLVSKGDTGEQGETGKSAYQSYLDTTADDPMLTEEQWSAGGGGGGDYLPLAGGTMDANASIIWGNASAIREAGAQGLEIECSVGYRWQWAAGRMILRQINSGQIQRVLAIDGVTPGNTEDISEGFITGTRWETQDGTIYECTDSTDGAAVWVDVTLSGIVTSGSSASLKDLALNPDALTGSLATSALNVTQTWNTTGNPTLLKGYVTNTASGSGAKLLDLGVGATTRLNLDASGHLCTNTADDYASFGFINSARGIGYNAASEKMLMYANASGIVNAGVNANGLFLPETSFLSWAATGWNTASDLFMSRAAAATLQLGVNHATTAIRQTIKGCNVTTGNGGELVLRAGTGTGGAVGTQGVWLGVPSANALKQYDFNGANLGGFYNEALRGYLRFAGGSGGDVTLLSNSSNGNIELTPHGTGRVKFGAFVSAGTHTPSGYIEIRDAGGTTRRLAVIA